MADLKKKILKINLFDDCEGDVASFVRPEDIFEGLRDDGAKFEFATIQIRHQKLERQNWISEPLFVPQNIEARTKGSNV